MSQVLGIDVSSWQHPDGKPIDWEEVRKAGYDFALVKATQSTNYVNPWLRRDLDDARAEGFLVGAYHFFETGVDPAAQAAHFVISLVGEKLDLGGWLDYEPPPLGDYVMAGEVQGFLTAAADGRPGCGLYCDKSTLEALQAINVGIARLWVAAWSDSEPGKGWLLWQRKAQEVPGIIGEVDVDVLVNTRGVDIPTSPPARPTAASVHPVKAESMTEQGPGVDSDNDEVPTEDYAETEADNEVPPIPT